MWALEAAQQVGVHTKYASCISIMFRYNQISPKIDNVDEVDNNADNGLNESSMVLDIFIRKLLQKLESSNSCNFRLEKFQAQAISLFHSTVLFIPNPGLVIPSIRLCSGKQVSRGKCVVDLVYQFVLIFI